MNKKYQVFVSSTYEDLKIERQEVIHALLELDCIPSGMELFPAADEDQWSLIKGVIDECDYYILILGGRYGSTNDEGIGYTEMEYRYALDTGKPIIAFLHKDPDSLPKKDTEKTEEGQKKFKEFGDLVKNKMCKYWETPQALGSVVSRSLIMLQKKHPGIGWVRGDLVPSQEASQEILDLRKQKEQLEFQLNATRTQAPSGTENLSQGEEEFKVQYSCKFRDHDYKIYTLSSSVDLSWDEIFYHISPIMIHEANDLQIRHLINEMIHSIALPLLKTHEERQDFKDFIIRNEDFQTIKIQIKALGLISKNDKNRSVKDTKNYWTLTPYGDSVMNRLRAIKKKGG